MAFSWQAEPCAQAVGRQPRAVRAGAAGDDPAAPALHAVCHPEPRRVICRAHRPQPCLPQVRDCGHPVNAPRICSYYLTCCVFLPTHNAGAVD